jgi:hypothetical protein
MIDEYFKSCWEEVWIERTNKEGSSTWIQKFDREGKPLMRLRERPTVTGLALALGTYRQTLIEYETKKDEFTDTIKRAKTVIEYYYEKGVAEGDIHPAVGIFVLKNFNWTDVVQINTTNTPEQLTTDDIKNRLNTMCKESNKAETVDNT